MEELKKVPLSAFMASILIGIGCAVFLSCDSRYVGALFFCVGLITICVMGYHLITGRICSSLGRGKSELIIIPVCIVANFIGCLTIGWVFRTFVPRLVEKATLICLTKLEQAPLQTVVLGILCGILMFVAVGTFQRQAGVDRYLGIIFGIPTFILAGFEHSIADAVYFVTSGLPVRDWAVYVLLVLAGNMIGGMLFPALMMLNDLFMHKGELAEVE